MNHTTSTIDTLLAEWGMTRRSLPMNHVVMKQAALTRLIARNGDGAPEMTKFRMAWLPLGLVCTAVVCAIVLLPRTQKQGTLTVAQEKSYSLGSLSGVGGPTTVAPNAMKRDSIDALPYLEESPATDSREYLKTDYTTTARTRYVVKNAERLETIVRGFGGRIDLSSKQDAGAQVSFVLPVARLDAFRNEVKLLFGEKFVDEHIQTDNLLPQKRGLEDEAKTTDEQIAALQGERDKLTTAHEQTVGTLQAQIKANGIEQGKLRAEMQNHPEEALFLQGRIAELGRLNSSLQTRLSTENVNYAAVLSTLSSQIKNAQSAKDSVQTQDDTLLDTVATVRGTITLARIGVVGWLVTYVPLAWIITLLLVASAIVAYIFTIRRPIAL